jgi:hypothetical protein
MATGGELANRVLVVIDDDSYIEDDVLVLMNDCAKKISEKYILPSLDTEGTVTTVTNLWSVPAPTDFQRNLYNAFCGGKLSILESKHELLMFNDHDPTKTGTKIEAVAIIGDLLYYAPIVTSGAQTITLSYQKKPAKITGNAQVNLLPGYLSEQDEMLMNYAKWQLYSQIEQGMEGAKHDTNYYAALFTGAFDELRFKFREGVSKPTPRYAQMNKSW